MTKLRRPVPTHRGVRRSKRDYSVENACSSKRGYVSWREAEDEVFRITDQNFDRGVPQHTSGLGVYRCRYCGAWHVGHSRGPVTL